LISDVDDSWKNYVDADADGNTNLMISIVGIEQHYDSLRSARFENAIQPNFKDLDDELAALRRSNFLRGLRDGYEIDPKHAVPNLPSKDFGGKSQIGQYGDKLMEGDHHVGQIQDALKDLKLDDNTILMFASDNRPQGETARELGNQATQDMGNSGPFRGELGEATEGSIRTFAFIRWPVMSSRIRPHTVHADVKQNAD
jgi:arylsulfatase A-like enzyme